MSYEAKHKFSDGSSIRGPRSVVDIGIRVEQDMRERERQWVAHLRAAGVKMAHPDDGWVDRREHSVSPCYPQFDDRPQVGDVIALGWPSGDTRLVVVRRVTERFRLPSMSVGYTYWFDPDGRQLGDDD